jgi:hypothetical protein
MFEALPPAILCLLFSVKNSCQSQLPAKMVAALHQHLIALIIHICQGHWQL